MDRPHISVARSGGQVLVDALKTHGVEMAFCVPGESFLPVIDALHDARESIRLIVCRHEAAASHMAEAHGKLTGKPGICLVTRGPGASHASIGIHTAAQDSTPMILLVGQVNSQFIGREAWQEIDVAGMFGSMAKWAVQIDSLQSIPEIISRAFQLAVSGRPGPVVIAIPEDVLYQQAAVADSGACQRVPVHARAADLQALQAMLDRAQRPLVILGGSGWDVAACADMRTFVERFDLPVCSSFRRQDLLDNQQKNYVGPLGPGVSDALALRVKQADLVLAIGTRLGETTTAEYQLLLAPRPAQQLIHIHANSAELGRVYQADRMIQASMPEFAHAVAQRSPGAEVPWRSWTGAARADYLETLKPTSMPGPLNLAEVMVWLRDRLPADSIITNGAGNYTSWVHRFYQYRGLHTQLAPTSGAMGYGVPAAIAAKLLHPERTVVCFAGDGCFQMGMLELATVKQYKLQIVFIVVNNRMYGSIRMHQEINFPGKVYATELENPDFVALGKSYGLHAQLVERTADFPAAFEHAMAAGTGALIELRTDPEAITPRTTLTALRSKALSQTKP
jgi:acetolactate synthase-1/2/3 large subunit